MESIEYNNNRRKSSCATVVPPQKQNRKLSTPLSINCKDNGRSAFYDTGSMTDMSPTTAVSSRRHLPVFPEEPINTSLLSSIRNKVLGVFLKKNNTDEEQTLSRASTQCEKTASQQGTIPAKHGNSTSEHSRSSTFRKNLSDPNLSPGSTAVGCDDDEERQGYFGLSSKKKKSPRGWVAAILMIIVGALIAVTFVLVGLGKALGGNNTAANAQTTTSSASLIPSATVTSTVTTVPAVPTITFTVVSPPKNQPSSTS